MSDKKYNSFDDDVLANLEKLKAKYSDFGSDYEDDDDFSYSAPENDEDLFEYEDEMPEKQPKRKEQYFEPAPEPLPVPKPVNTEPAAEEDYRTEEIDYEEAEKNIFSEVVYTGSETKYSKEKKTMSGKKKHSSSKIFTVIFSLLILLIIWGALFAIDYVTVSSSVNNEPLFCIKTQKYANGSEDFTGLFYKYQRHIDKDGEIEFKCLPWFVKGDNDMLEKLDEGEEVVSASTDDLMTLEITIPAEFIEEDTTNGLKLTAEQKAQGFEAVKLNKDGSATYRIQKGNYRIFLAKLKNNLSVDLKSLAEDKDYPSIKKVEFTNDLSTVTLYVDKEGYLDGLDHFIDQSIFEWVGKYKSFANQVPTCELIIKNVEDNSVIQENKG